MTSYDLENAAFSYDYSQKLPDCKTSLHSIGYIVQWYEWKDDKYVYHSELLDTCGAVRALEFDSLCKYNRLQPLPFRLVGIDPR